MKAKRIRPLTGREMEVLRMMCNGETNYDISYSLGVTEATIKAHATNIMSKLGTHNRVKTIVKAMQKRLVTFTSLTKI
jgi:DNA-binding NarL/FixJ family response regulator